MNRKKLIFILAVVCIIIFVIFAFIFGDKNLDLNSNEVSSLYKYLGEVDIYHCGGLSTYSENTITKDDISDGNKLCMAYYNLNQDKVKKETIDSYGVNKNDIKICKVGENITLATNNDEDFCNYFSFSKNELNNSYNDIYGTEISNYNSFYISSSNSCYLEGETYYCGTSETFTYSLAEQATVYRLLNKAVQQLNGDIIIYDYFLKVTEDSCYDSSDSKVAMDKCSKALDSQNEIDAEFVRKYGSIYKHTFKKNSNGDYYWAKSELK